MWLDAGVSIQLLLGEFIGFSINLSCNLTLLPPQTKKKKCLVLLQIFMSLLYSSGLCTLGTVCCFRAGVDLLHHYSPPPEGVEGSLGWSLYLALISFPLQMMVAALFLWAARSHRKNYTRMTAYRVA